MLSWRNYWQSDPKVFGIVMQKSTAYFARNLISGGYISPGNRVLDYGCGPGYLVEQLQGIAGDYWGVDISQSYINVCTSKFANMENYHFSVLTDAEEYFSFPAETDPPRFDLIIILSVVQYFQDKNKVTNLLQKCKSYLAPGGKIILADVIQSENSLIRDLWNVFINSIRERYFFSFLSFMKQLRFSRYNVLRKNHTLLSLTKEEISTICSELALSCEVLPSLTLQKSRRSYCIMNQ